MTSTSTSTSTLVNGEKRNEQSVESVDTSQDEQKDEVDGLVESTLVEAVISTTPIESGNNDSERRKRKLVMVMTSIFTILLILGSLTGILDLSHFEECASCLNALGLQNITTLSSIDSSRSNVVAYN